MSLMQRIKQGVSQAVNILSQWLRNHGHIVAAPVLTSVRVTGSGGSPINFTALGQQSQVTATPLDQNGNVYRPTTIITWAVTDATVVALSPNGAAATLTSLAVGSSAVTATAIAGAQSVVSRSLSISVQVIIPPPPPTTCTFSISPTSHSFSSSAGTGSIAVTASANTCAYTAVSNNTWILITGGSSLVGSGTVTYSVTANTISGRSGTITVAGKTFTVTQSAYVPPPPPPPPPTPGLLQPSDITFVGWMRLPNIYTHPGYDSDFMFTNGGFTSRVVDGTLRFFILASQSNGNPLVEVVDTGSYDPVMANAPIASLASGPAGGLWGGLGLCPVAAGDVGIPYGLLWTGDGNIYVSYGAGYTGGNHNNPAIKLAVINDSNGSVLAYGPWRSNVGSQLSARQGLFAIPSAFATTYTGGKAFSSYATQASGYGSSPYGTGLYALNLPTASDPPDPVNNEGVCTIVPQIVLSYDQFHRMTINARYRRTVPVDSATGGESPRPWGGGIATGIPSDFQQSSAWAEELGQTLGEVWVDLPNKQGLLTIGTMVTTIDGYTAPGDPDGLVHYGYGDPSGNLVKNNAIVYTGALPATCNPATSANATNPSEYAAQKGGHAFLCTAPNTWTEVPYDTAVMPRALPYENADLSARNVRTCYHGQVDPAWQATGPFAGATVPWLWVHSVPTLQDAASGTISSFAATTSGDGSLFASTGLQLGAADSGTVYPRRFTGGSPVIDPTRRLMFMLVTGADGTQGTFNAKAAVAVFHIAS